MNFKNISEAVRTLENEIKKGGNTPIWININGNKYRKEIQPKEKDIRWFSIQGVNYVHRKHFKDI